MSAEAQAHSPQERSWSWAPLLAGGFLVIALPWLQRWLYLFPDGDHLLYYSGDFVELAAQRGYFFHTLAQGKLVLWDPLMGTGQPFLSYLFDLFNPISLLSVFYLQEGVLRNEFAQTILAVHCSIAGLGAFLLGLQMGLGRTAATIMGMVMGCMGVVVAHSHHSMMIQTFCWAPYVFLFLQRGRQKSPWLNGAWAGVVFGMCFIGGIPQIFYYVMFGVGLYVIYWAVLDIRQGGWRRALSRGLSVYIALGIASGLMALPNLLHLLMAALGDPVGVHDAAALAGKHRVIFSQQMSGHWGMLVSFLAPGFMGISDEYTSYVGILPLALALLALVYVKNPTAGFWKLLTLAGVILMLGGNFGLHKVLLDILPGYELFRVTARWVFLSHLGLLVLAGYGLAWLFSRPQAADLKPASRFLAVVSSLLLGLILAVLVLSSLNIPGQNLNSALPVLSMLGWPLFMLCALWWVLHRLARGASFRALGLLLVALVALDVGFFYAPMTAWDRGSFGKDPSLISPEQDQRAAHMARLAAGDWPSRVLANRGEIGGFLGELYRHRLELINPPGGYMDRMLPLGFWQIWWHKDQNPRFLDLLAVKVIENNNPLLKATRDNWVLVGHSQSAAPLPPGGTVRELALDTRVIFAQHAAPGDTLARVTLVDQDKAVHTWPLRLGQELEGKGKVILSLPQAVPASEVILSSSHPRSVVQIKALTADGVKLADRVFSKPLDTGFRQNLRALDKAFFVSRAAVVEPDWEYGEALLSLDPSRSLIFRQAPPGYQPPQKPALTPGGQVKAQKWQDEKVELTVSAQRDGYLVMSQSAFQGWRARLDGKPAPIFKAYGFLIAVPVPPENTGSAWSTMNPW